MADDAGEQASGSTPSSALGAPAAGGGNGPAGVQAPTAPAPGTQAAGAPPGGAQGSAAPAPAAELFLKLPEGLKLEELGELPAAFKSAGLDSAKAQAVLDTVLKLDGARQAKAREAYEAREKGWAEALKADKEFGGPGLQANMEVMRRALVKFGTPELRKSFDELGVGNHPELARFVYRVGKALAEDSIAGSTGNGAAKSSNDMDALLRAQYPSMFRQE